MPDIEEIYGGSSARFMKTSDLKENEVLECDIVSVEPTDIKGTTKLVAQLKSGRAFVINKTNAQRLAEQFGTPDYTKWVEKKFKLVRSYTNYGGEEVGCLRVQRRLE